MITRLFSPDWIYTLGWTLVDTLWIGAAFALLLGICLVFMRRFSAQARHSLAIGLLFTFFGTTIYTGFLHYQDATQIVNITPVEATSPTDITIPNIAIDASVDGVINAPIAATTPSLKERLIQYYDQHLPLIVTLWLMGILVLQLRLLGQLAVVQRLKSYGTARFPKQWATALHQLEEQFDIEKPVRYLTSSKVMSPMVIGWLRPVVLFPNFLLDKLKESEVIGIMAHELAHVKRNDFLVNILQNILCTLFFYHPGIWWMSARIEEEREHCCDDMAIAATGQAMTLAKTLIHLKEQELSTPELAAAFAGKKRGFQHRIRRMITGYLRHATYGEGVITTLILVLTISAVTFVQGQNPTQAPMQSEAPTVQQEEVTLTTETRATTQAAESKSILPTTTALDRQRENAEPLPTPSIAPTTSTPDNLKAPESINAQIDLLTDANDDNPCGQLLKAIRTGDLNTIEQLLATTNANCVDPDPTWTKLANGSWEEDALTPLHAAARIGRLDILKILVNKGADINKYVEGDGTPLLTAAAYGHLNIVTYLVGAGVNPNDKFPNHGSAIMLAAFNGHPEIIRYLSQFASSVETPYTNQGTLLIAAAHNGNLETLNFLLAQGAKVDTRTPNQGTALIAAANNGQVDALKLLIEAGAEIDLQTPNQGTALIAAANNGALDAVRYLLEAGADINQRASNQGTALIAAANNGHARTLRYLIEKGAVVNMIMPNQGTALIAAANNGQLDAIKILLRNDAEINQTTPNQGTALMVAANNGQLATVKYLVEQGANPNIKIGNRTAITEAASNGHTDVMQYLMNLE